MKTKDFLVEYEGIGDDAAAMHAENEVQECRQKCYQAAKHAIKLHKMLQDVADTHDLEDWVLEKLTQAASDLQEVSDHLEYESYSEEEFELSQPDFDQSFDDHFPTDETLLSLGEENNPVSAVRDINNRLQANQKTFKNKGADAARKDLMRITQDRSRKYAPSFPLEESEFEYSSMDPKDVYADLGRKMLEVNKIFASAPDQQTKMAARKSLVQLSQRRERARKEMEAAKAGNVARGSDELSLQAMAGNPLPRTRGFTAEDVVGDTIKGVKRAINGKLPAKEVEHDYGRRARRDVKFGTKAQADKSVAQYHRIAKVVNKEDIDEARRTNIGKTLARKVDAIEKRQGREPTKPASIVTYDKGGRPQFNSPPSTYNEPNSGVMAHDDGFGPRALSPAAQKRADIKLALKKSGMVEGRSLPGTPDWDKSVARGKKIVKKYKNEFSDERIQNDLLWNMCQNVPERVWKQFVEAVFAVDEDTASDDREMKAGMNDTPAQKPAMAPASRPVQQAAVKKANQSAPDSLDFTEDAADGSYLEQEVRKALRNGDDYTAKSYAKMEKDPNKRKALNKIIRSDMYPSRQVNEISKATKDRYVSRASSEHGMANFGAQVSNKPDEKKAFARERDKRAKGIRLALTGKSIQQEDASAGASCSGAVAAVVSPLGTRSAPKAKARSFKNSIKSPKVKMGKGIY